MNFFKQEKEKLYRTENKKMPKNERQWIPYYKEHGNFAMFVIEENIKCVKKKINEKNV